jgi:predicted nucleic acid-binding protein
MVAGIALEGGHRVVARDRDFQSLGAAFGLRVDTC